MAIGDLEQIAERCAGVVRDHGESGFGSRDREFDLRSRCFRQPRISLAGFRD
jgi:hypothetical protein